ncbi:translation protein SH3-like domain-containing protein [Ampelomyces quisqualis]|uniref:Translation protein SH3-like domain-containing protein n=1 Tax=Ampelomyces quisqualis TaxID=50730 RepID=A0A6A5QU08_AMPQU|nr:translation protein SH3-like domain-containing protein [Ampelomyces quisqualis]
MSTAVSCTRAIVPRVTCRAQMCRRYASTEAIAVESAGAATLFTPQRPKKKPEPLSIEMHRKMYPHLYDKIDAVNWQPQKKVNRYQRRPARKRIDPKWATVMRVKGVSKQMSSRFGVPVFIPQTSNIKKTCPDPVKAVTASQTSLLDPSAARTRLFAKDNPECARVGDILLVRQRTGDPFAGVCINIRRRGIDTAILLRGQLTRVGVEMWYKIYSPLVEGIEVVQRAAKRARRARLTYMRTAKHDRGSVENVVRIYLRQKAALGMADGGKKKSMEAAAAAMGGAKKKGKGRGKKR